MDKKTLSAERHGKIIVILGPTSSGKSDVAIQLAKKFDGEIISADSRQIYRGMDVGTGKIIQDNSHPSLPSGEMSSTRDREGKTFYSEGIAHYGIDIISPRTEYSVAKFKKYTDKKIRDILSRGKLPIICGGTGFWIKAIVDNVVYPEVAPDWKLRNQLQKYSTEKLFTMLQKLDPARAKNIDAKNTVRLIRAIEICKSLGKVPTFSAPSPLQEEGWGEVEFLQIGISHTKEKLNKRIKLRLQQRFEEGMIEEVQELHFKDKISWKRLESFGLGYKLIPQYLRGEISNKETLFEQIYNCEKDYAKRQMTWFSRDKRIVWLDNYKDIKKTVKSFIK